MAYVAPTPAQLKARFPAFAAVDTAVIQGALDEAAGRVDTSWREADFALAQMLYASHVLTTDGHGAGEEADAIAEGAGLIKRKQAGGSAIEFASASASGSVALLGSLLATSYGRRFSDLLRANFSGPITV